MKLVFPVRFAEGERVVQTTADEITENGTYVISTTPPAVGAGVTLSLYLPDAADPVNVNGVVRTAEGGEQRPGFGVEFSAIAGDGLVRIRKVLQLAQSTGAPNLRAFQRTPVELTAVITTPKGTVETRIRDISPAGMFIEMEKMPAFAAVFPVLLQLPDGEPPLLVTVQSVRQETGASGRAAGVGVRFVGGTDEFRVRLDAFLRPDSR
jgi:Tfp pilus assembly protein PilZ